MRHKRRSATAPLGELGRDAAVDRTVVLVDSGSLVVQRFYLGPGSDKQFGNIESGVLCNLTKFIELFLTYGNLPREDPKRLPVGNSHDCMPIILVHVDDIVIRFGRFRRPKGHEQSARRVSRRDASFPSNRRGHLTFRIVCGVLHDEFATLLRGRVLRYREGVVRLISRGQSSDFVPFSEIARAVALPELKKAAFIFGGEYGKGVMSCRAGEQWSAPVFMQLAKGSWGFQAGVEQADLVLLVMNEKGVQKLLQNKVTLGADASIAAGPIGRRGGRRDRRGADGRNLLAYSRSQGLFAGIDVSGGVLRPDEEVNVGVYGAGATPRTILANPKSRRRPKRRAFLRALEPRRRAGQHGRAGGRRCRLDAPRPRNAARR